MTFILIALYLTAIVAANLTVATFGPSVTVINAFLFIGLDISTRDRLHELWKDDKLTLKMGALIGAGSVISYLINAGAAQIALASFVAFALSAMVDTAVFSRMWRRKWLIKSNTSNIASAAVDSLLFPVIAFGAFLPLIILGQFIAKVAGGFIWSLILSYTRKQLSFNK